MPTILSRFDTIFIVKDEHNQQRDIVSFCLQKNISNCITKSDFLDNGQTYHERPYELGWYHRRTKGRRTLS